MTDSITTCRLCLLPKQLRKSHIIPAFVGRYLKETSATGYLRDAASPNIRRQDLPTIELLCEVCEQSISRWERDFAQNIFPIVQNDNFKEIHYDDSLLKFAVSLSWRELVTQEAALKIDLPQFSNRIAKTLENWRKYLLGITSQPYSVHHLFIFAGAPKSLPGDTHPKFLYYALRGIDSTEAVSQRCIAVYVKLLRSIFYSPVVPSNPAGWKNTRIHAGPGKLISPQIISMPGFADLLNSCVEEGHAVPISESQNEKIRQSMMKDPLSAISSESYKVHPSTRRLLGE